MNNKGQAVFSEYVMIFFIVIAVTVAMTTFVQRSLEGRIHDARDFLINTVNNGACDANCMSAAGIYKIPYEYEPYYEQFASTVQNYENDATGATPGNPKILGVKYLASVNGVASSSSTSVQMPAVCSSDNPPPCCSDGTGCAVCKCEPGHVCGPDSCGNAGVCGSCGNPLQHGCNYATGQCYACTCPTYPEPGFCSAYGLGPTYTANCGADSCGNANACGPSCSTTYGAGVYCMIGRCWEPSGNCANCAHPCY